MPPFKFSTDTSVKDIFLYNPYDVETNLISKGFNEDSFKDFFYLIPEFKEYAERISNYISPGDYHKNFVVLSGYSGSGKTTLLNWLKNDYLSNDYYFNITNLNKYPISESNINLLQKSIVLELKKLYKIPNESNLIYDNLNILKDFSTDNMFIDNIFEIYTIHQNGIEMDDRKLNTFLNNLEFKDLLFIYILENISRINIDDYKSITFCFDNLDDVKFEYLTENFWNDFKAIRRFLIQFFNSKPSGLNFDFQGKFTFILTFREANLIIRSSDYLDRITNVLITEKLVLSESARKIISKRLDFLKTYFRIKLEKSKISYLIYIISKSKYTDTFYLPLFNYDYRKLMQAIVEIGTSQQNNHSIPISESRYFEIRSNSIRMARGTIIHRLIKYLFKNDYLLNFASIPSTPNSLPQNGFCRKSRLLLTIIYRFSYPNGIPKDVFKILLVKPKKVSVYEVFKSYSELFPEDIEALELLESFFDIFKTSWTHLISIYNHNNLGDRVKIDFETEKKILKDIKNGDSQTELLHENLKNYKIHINASGYIYLRNILIHFEYFTNLINERTTKNHKSLVEAVEFDKDKNKFEFQIIIEKILKKLNNYKTNIDNFIKYEIIDNNKTLEWFLKEEYVFKQNETTNPSLYFTRIVSSHIEYIDNFRSLIFKDKTIIENINNNNKTIQEINTFLVDAIETYIKILDRGHQDVISVELSKGIKREVKKAKIKGLEFWLPINTSQQKI